MREKEREKERENARNSNLAHFAFVSLSSDDFTISKQTCRV
jgi:hypothetical protein